MQHGVRLRTGTPSRLYNAVVLSNVYIVHSQATLAYILVCIVYKFRGETIELA